MRLHMPTAFLQRIAKYLLQVSTEIFLVIQHLFSFIGAVNPRQTGAQVVTTSDKLAHQENESGFL